GLATLRHGDRIVRLNGDTVRTWNDLIEGIVSGGTDLDFAVAGRAEALRVHLRDGSLRARQQLAQALVRLEPPRLGLLEPGRPAIRAGLRPGDLIVPAFLKGLVLGQLSPRDVGGPILVGQISGQVARLGIDWFLTFVAFFSVNLAVLNLVPIPILDGGQVLFLLIEAVRRKPLSVELRTRLSQIGFLVV